MAEQKCFEIDVELHGVVSGALEASLVAVELLWRKTHAFGIIKLIISGFQLVQILVLRGLIIFFVFPLGERAGVKLRLIFIIFFLKKG